MTIYRFGAYRLDTAARELRHHDRRLDTSPRALECLLHLLANRDRAVGRDELVAAVWGRESISDNLLGKTLLKARRLVGDNGDAQEVVRTIPRFGYRWVADVEVVEATEDAGRTAASAATASSRPPSRAAAWALLPVLAVLALALFAFTRDRRPETSPALDAIDGLVAVRPFEVVADDDWHWLRYGLMDLATTRLRDAGLAMVPSETMVALASRAPDGIADGRVEAARAEKVVRPGIRQTGRGWQVHVELRQRGRVVREIDVQRDDPLAATEEAIRRLAKLLRPPGAAADADSVLPRSLTESLQRSEAAMLEEDFAAARRWVDAVPPSLRAAPELRLRKALIDYRTGALDDASRELQALAERLSAGEEPALRARAFMGIGAVALKRRHAAEAVTAFEAALALLQGQGDAFTRGYALMGRATAHAIATRHAEAGADFAQARVLLEASGDSLALARIDMSEGVMAMESGAHDEAHSLLRRAEQRFELLGTPSELATTRLNRIELLLLHLRPIEAQELAERLQALSDRVANPLERHAIAARRADVLAALGRNAEASRLRRELEPALDPANERALLGALRLAAAEAALQAGRYEEAVPLAGQATDLSSTVEAGCGRALLVGVRARLALGRVADATHLLATMRDRCAGRDVPERALAMLAAAEATPPEGRGEAYDAAWRAAAASAPSERVVLIESYVGWLLDAGDLARATPLAGQAARWADQDFRSALVQARLHRARGDVPAWRGALTRARALAGERAIPPELLAVR